MALHKFCAAGMPVVSRAARLVQYISNQSVLCALRYATLSGPVSYIEDVMSSWNAKPQSDSERLV